MLELYLKNDEFVLRGLEREMGFRVRGKTARSARRTLQSEVQPPAGPAERTVGGAQQSVQLVVACKNQPAMRPASVRFPSEPRFRRRRLRAGGCHRWSGGRAGPENSVGPGGAAQDGGCSAAAGRRAPRRRFSLQRRGRRKAAFDRHHRPIQHRRSV